MKIKTISYAMLRTTAQFENDRVEVIVELEKGDSLGDAVREAKSTCEAALASRMIKPTITPTFEAIKQRIDTRAQEHVQVGPKVCSCGAWWPCKAPK